MQVLMRVLLTQFCGRAVTLVTASALNCLGENLMHTIFRIPLLVAALSLNMACAPPGSPHYHTQNGALMGATAGAVIGHQLNHRDGAWVGGATGALLGAAVGSDMDRQDQYNRYYDDDSDGGYAPPPPNRYRRPPPGYYAPQTYSDYSY